MDQEYLKERLITYLNELESNPPQWFIENVKNDLDLNVEDDVLQHLIVEAFEGEEDYDEELEIEYLNQDLLARVKELAIMPGLYHQGQIEAKEYFILALNEDIFLDLSLEDDELIDSRMIYSFGYVNIKPEYVVDLNGGLLLELSKIKELGFDSGLALYNALQPEEEINEKMYKVGYDIASGIYAINESDDAQGFVEIYNGPIGDEDEEFTEVFEEAASFNLVEGQYLYYYDGLLTKLEKGVS